MENPYLVHIERHMARPNPLELGDLLLCLNLSKIIFPSRGASPLLETENSRPSHDISIFPPGEVCSHAFLSRFPNSSSARAAFMFTVVSRLPEMEYSNPFSEKMSWKSSAIGAIRSRMFMSCLSIYAPFSMRERFSMSLCSRDSLLSGALIPARESSVDSSSFGSCCN